MIFVSYRKKDVQDAGERLAAILKREFGDDHVIVDNFDIAAGEEWPASLQKAVDRCDVLLAVIGKNWLSLQDDFGTRLIDNPRDRVRLEIGAAIEKQKCVVALLVDQAKLPERESLPEGPLRSLPESQAIRLNGPLQDVQDLSELLHSLRQHLPQFARTATQMIHLFHQTALSDGEKRQLVLDAEIIDFPIDDRPVVCASLREFVLAHRGSNIPQDLIAVGSAIRKLVVYLPSTELGTLVVLLTPNPRMAIPLEIELEVTKTVVRKLASAPPVQDDSEPELAEKLMEIASAYLNLRLLSREKYGATALNAVLGLLLLRSRHVADVTARVESLGADWFTQSVCHRIERLEVDLRRRVPAEKLPTILRCLEIFDERFVHVNKTGAKRNASGTAEPGSN